MLAAALFSVFIGVALGLLGGGGSILTVPILVYAIGLEDKVAIATSLLVVGVTSAVASLSSIRAGAIPWRVTLVFAAAGMLGAFGGGRLAAYIPGSVLLVLFALVMAGTAVAMWRGRGTARATSVDELPYGKIFAEGSVVGIVTGLVGAGGGFLIVPALVLWAGLPMHQAIASSLVIIALKSFAAFAGYLAHVQIDYRLAAVVTTAAVLGSFAGALGRGRLRPEVLRRGFAVFVAGTATFLLVQQIG